MCLLHNAILRGYNSIYLQAPHVRDADKPGFVGYCLTWHKFVTSHADDEEAVLFTMVEDLLDDKTVWEASHKEHGTAGSSTASLLLQYLLMTFTRADPRLQKPSSPGWPPSTRT